MNVKIFGVPAMECMCAQTRPQFILSSERALGGMESEPMLTPTEQSPQPEKFSPEEDRTRNSASSRTASPTHYQRAIQPCSPPPPPSPPSLADVAPRWNHLGHLACFSLNFSQDPFPKLPGRPSLLLMHTGYRDTKWRALVSSVTPVTRATCYCLSLAAGFTVSSKKSSRNI